MTIDDYSGLASKKLDEVKEQYQTYDYRHAIAILTIDYPQLLIEICDVLLQFELTIEQIKKAGGNESDIPKTFSKMLRPLGWKEEKFEAKFVIEDKTVSSDTHKIDYVKGEVAFDLEWNRKPATFDRNMRSIETAFRHGDIALTVVLAKAVYLSRLVSRPNTYRLGGPGIRQTSASLCWGRLPVLNAYSTVDCPILLLTEAGKAS